MNFNISSTLLEKMWNTIVDKGISALLRPWQMKRENQARLECLRDEKIQTIKMNSEAKQLQNSLDNTPSTIANTTTQIKQIASEVINTKLQEMVREEISIAKAVEHACEYIEKENLKDEKPQEKPTLDWLNKWKKNAQEFSDNNMLMLWGQILAGEFAAPGKYSYKFLDWMSNLKSNDACLISKLMENVFDNIYYRGENIDQDMPLTYSELLTLQELDVIQGVEASGMSLTCRTSQKGLFTKAFLSANLKKIILAEHSDSTKEIKINNPCPLTRIGIAVKSLCNTTSNPRMIQLIGEHIAKQGFDVYCADVRSIENNNIDYFNKTKIKFNNQNNL